MGIRQEARERRREEILEAALDLFVSKGYAQTKIGDIAEKVGMSVGLLFHYFESKARLYEELVLIGAQGPISIAEEDARDPARFLEGAAEYVLSSLRGDTFVARMFVFMAQARLNSPMPEGAREMLKESRLIEKTVAIIERGQELGQLRPGNAEALSALFWQSLSGLALRATANPEAPLPEARWIVDGLRDRPAEKAAPDW